MNDGLKVDNLNYEGLNNISFSLDRGTVTGLIGKNNTEKTLLLKCLAGICNISGTININSISISDFGIVNENIGLYLGTLNLSNGSVFSNIIEPLKNLGIPEKIAKSKIYEIIKKLGIGNLVYKNIDDLSYGQKKIVSFAKTIIHDPNLILLDNLFESLDSYYLNKVIEYLKYLKSTKQVIVILTTNDSDNLLICDNLMVIKNGKIIENKRREQLFEDEIVFTKNGLELPFIIDLCYKLKSYGILDSLIYNYDEMVDEIWK